MGDFKINEKTVFSQSGTDEPAMGSTVTGIPAAGVTGVLPSAVTGGSGLTALGTVTAGNLSNTAIVYPVGHVVNTWTKNHTLGTFSVSIAGTWANVTYGGSVGLMNITGITATAGNKLFISCNPGSVRTNSDGTYATDVGLKIDTSSFTCVNVFYNQNYLKANGNFNMVYTVPSSFSNKTIGLWAGSAAGASMLENTVNATPVSSISLIVQEIQQ